MYALVGTADLSNVFALALVFCGFLAVKTGLLAIMWWGWRNEKEE